MSLQRRIEALEASLTWRQAAARLGWTATEVFREAARAVQAAEIALPPGVDVEEALRALRSAAEEKR